MHLQKSKITTLLEKALMEKSAIEPESIILFGSFAKGNYTESSDIDILIVLRSDLDWFDRQLLEMMFYENKGFILDVLEDGIILHDKGYWKEKKRKFLDRKKSGIIKKIKNGWKICTD